MRKYHYTITGEDGGFNITFPDIPEANTSGSSLDEAINNAHDSLLDAIDYYEDYLDKFGFPLQETITEYFIEV